MSLLLPAFALEYMQFVFGGHSTIYGHWSGAFTTAFTIALHGAFAIQGANGRKTGSPAPLALAPLAESFTGHASILPGYLLLAEGSRS